MTRPHCPEKILRSIGGDLLVTHKPRFLLRTHGGECAGSQWVYDGDEPIALFERRPIEQPEQNLRYFNAVPRPVNLRYLKLKPGGRPLVSGVQLYWKLSPDIATTELLDVSVEGQGSERLRMTVLTRDPAGVATSRRITTITYDLEMNSYVYDFECHLDVHSPDTVRGSEDTRFEYSDPWYVDLPAPSVAFPGMWVKRPYTHVLCERADGSVHKMPLHHVGLRRVSSSQVRPGSLLLPVFDPGNNPAIQFLGDAACNDRVSVCYWGYDVHLQTSLSDEDLSEPILRRFRIFLCPDGRARELMDAAEPVPPIEMQGMTELPLYERKISFEKSCPLNQPTPGVTDPWPWLPEGEGLAYEREFGRSDRYSLKIERETPGYVAWYTDREGEGSFTEPWPDHVGFRVTGYVKTEHVGGRGSCIAIRWERYNQTQVYPYAYSPWLRGTNDWTRISVELSGRHPEDCSAVRIALIQDGPGVTWFDDLEVEVLHGEVPDPCLKEDGA